MKQLSIYLLTLASTLLISTQQVNACTDFRTIAKDGTVIITRSMEFAIDMQSNLRSSIRGRTITNVAPNGKPALSWKATYGYLYVDSMNQDIAVDGLNENGLSFEYLYLPGETQYQTVPQGKEAQAIPYTHFGDWVLGNFKTVDEVRQALVTKFIFEQTLPGLGSTIFPVHAAIEDAGGNGIVVEFVNGNMNIHNYVGVMTNSPTYDWQVTNLRNYVNLSPYNPKPVIAGGMTFSATGQGSGMVGLPGDVSPPSRFVKVAFMMGSVFPTNTAYDALNMAEHIINNVDIPAGLARAVDNGKISTDMTQWVVFKDLTHRIMYYRTYNDMTLRSVSMGKLDLSEKGRQLKMPLSQTPYIMDVTSNFLKSQ